MEPIVFFGLGVVTVMAMGLIVGTVMLQRQVVDLRHNLEFLQKQMELSERSIYDSVRGSENLCRELDRRIDQESQSLYRTLDSRLDKLENKLSTKK
jgi:uncharacterized protein HemX